MTSGVPEISMDPRSAFGHFLPKFPQMNIGRIQGFVLNQLNIWRATSDFSTVSL